MQRTIRIGMHGRKDDLQYYMHDGSTAFRFTLAGNLSNDSATELEQAWLTASSIIGERGLVVDLTGITGIGESGRELLLRWCSAGATLIARRSEARAVLASVPGLALAPEVRESRGESARRWPAWSRLSLRLGALALLLPAAAIAASISTPRPESAESEAFARYIVSVAEANPFQSAEPVVVQVEASLPALYKESKLVALRRRGDSGRTEYLLLGAEGDDTVNQEIVVPYMALEDKIQELPGSTVAVTPANYRFHYTGVIGSGPGEAHVFRITPKRKRDGLMEGKLWIDALTGIGVLETGRLVKTPSGFAAPVEVVRDTKLVNGVPAIRVTHVALATRKAGRGELTITEYRMGIAGEDPAQVPSSVGVKTGGGGRLLGMSQ